LFQEFQQLRTVQASYILPGYVRAAMAHDGIGSSPEAPREWPAMVALDLCVTETATRYVFGQLSETHSAVLCLRLEILDQYVIYDIDGLAINLPHLTV
jgi:hypothetical protein